MTTAQPALHNRPVRSVVIGMDENKPKKLDPFLARADARIAFGRAIPFQVWRRQIENGRAVLVEVDVTDRHAPRKSVGETAFDDHVVPLLLRRGKRGEVVYEATRLVPGDKVVLMTCSSSPAEAQRSLGVVSPG